MVFWSLVLLIVLILVINFWAQQAVNKLTELTREVQALRLGVVAGADPARSTGSGAGDASGGSGPTVSPMGLGGGGR